MFEDRLVLVAAMAATAFTLLLFAAPLMAPYGTYVGLDGNPGFVDHDWGSNLPSDVLYMIGDVLCHQQQGRSFVLNGSEMPVCIRDIGLAIGLSAGLAAGAILRGRSADRRIAAAGVAMACVTVVEWVAEHWVGDMPEARFATAIVSGVGVALFLCWSLYRKVPERD